MKQRDARRELGKHVALQLFQLLGRGPHTQLVGLLDERADDKHLATGVDLLADEVVGIGPLFGRDEPSLYGSPARGHLVEDRDVEVTEERQAERARNGRGGHRQEKWRAVALLPQR